MPELFTLLYKNNPDSLYDDMRHTRKNEYINILRNIITIGSIIRKYTDIKLVEKNKYKYWIELNFLAFEDLLKMIKERISYIYNIYDKIQFQLYNWKI